MNRKESADTAFMCRMYLIQNYKKRFSGLFPAGGRRGKEIALFADDTVIGMYFEQYGKKYPPTHIVALEEGGLPDTVCDIPVTSFDSLSVKIKIKVMYTRLSAVSGSETGRDAAVSRIQGVLFLYR